MFLLFAIATDVPPPPPPAPVVITVPAPPAPSGHFTCRNGQVEQYDTPCVRDTTIDPGPNPGSDVPEQMAGAGDTAYADDMVAQFCAVKPVVCEDGRP